MVLWLRDIIWLSQILSLRNVLLCLSCLFYVQVRFKKIWLIETNYFFFGYYCFVVGFGEVFFIFRIVWLTSCKLPVCWILVLFKNWVIFSAVFWVFSFFIKKHWLRNWLWYLLVVYMCLRFVS